MPSKHLVAASSEPLILALLSREESYGYAIIQHIRAISGGTLEWTDGMLYPVLHRLEKRGLIEARWGTSPQGRRRKYYKASDAGQHAMGQACSDWRAVTAALETLWRQGDQAAAERACDAA